MRIVILSILGASCATTPTTLSQKGGPRGLRASEHMQEAAQQDARAEHDSASAESSMIGVAATGARDQPMAMPWYRSWNAGADHARLAAIQRSEAAQLEVDYDDACRGLAGKQPSISPLGRFAVGGWPTANGVIVYLSPMAGSPDLLLAMMKCHRAFMMLAPANMDDCPLDIAGLVLDARGTADGITVSLSVNDPALVPELKRRATHELESSRQLGKQSGDNE